MHSNAQLIKQNKTKMCRLREDWAQWIDLRLILLKSVLLFQVTYCSVTKLISPNSTMSVNDFHEYKSTPHTNQMNYIQNNKTMGTQIHPNWRWWLSRSFKLAAGVLFFSPSRSLSSYSSRLPSIDQSDDVSSMTMDL